MRKEVVTLLFCLVACLAFGQRYHHSTAAEDKLAEKYYQCLHRNKYTVVQRLHFYPFNKAVSVKLVSFEDVGPPRAKIRVDGDTLSHVKEDSIYEAKIPFRKESVNYAAFKEIKTLNKIAVNKLTDILYNIGYTGPQLMASDGSSCFNPRNAILFIDARGKTFAYVDICFECSRYYVTPEKINMGGLFCKQKFDIIKGFFKSAGIEYGVTRIN